MAKQVRCIDADVYDRWITNGKTYKVSSETIDSYFIRDNQGVVSQWHRTRFEVVSETKKKRVRCIEGSLINYKGPPLIVGNVYEVVSEKMANYYMIALASEYGLSETQWARSRFVVVDDDMPVSATPIDEETRLRNLLTRCASDNSCSKCGSPKICSYHPEG